MNKAGDYLSNKLLSGGNINNQPIVVKKTTKIIQKQKIVDWKNV